MKTEFRVELHKLSTEVYALSQNMNLKSINSLVEHLILIHPEVDVLSPKDMEALVSRVGFSTVHEILVPLPAVDYGAPADRMVSDYYQKIGDESLQRLDVVRLYNLIVETLATH